jgi:hypothetical protein
MSANTLDTSFGTRLSASLSPRLLLSELLLKQWFEPVIPFTLMIALLLWFSRRFPTMPGWRIFFRCCASMPSSASSPLPWRSA